jgi:uncharacterized membrane protein
MQFNSHRVFGAQGPRRSKFGVAELVIALVLGIGLFVAGPQIDNSGDGFANSGWIAQIVGAVIVVAAVIGFVFSRKRTANIEKLIASGKKVTGVVVGVQMIDNGMVRHQDDINGRGMMGNRMGNVNTMGINGVNIPMGGMQGFDAMADNATYRVTVAADDGTGAVRNYQSDAVRGLSALAVQNFKTTPVPVDVYIDPTNPKNYYVNVSDLPNLTTEKIAELVKQAVATRDVTDGSAAVLNAAENAPVAPVTPAEQSAGDANPPAAQP